MFRLSSKKGAVLLYLLLTEGMQNRVKDKGKKGKPKSVSSGLWAWCGLDKMVSSIFLIHLMESNAPGWARQVNRGMWAAVCSGKQWELGTDMSLRLVSRSRLWILTNRCRNTPSPCWGAAAKKPNQSAYVKTVFDASYSVEGSGYKKDRPACQKNQESNSHRKQPCHWNQWEFSTKHLWVAEHQLIFLPATICEKVFTLFSYFKQWIFEIFPIALVPSKRCRHFQVR